MITVDNLSLVIKKEISIIFLIISSVTCFSQDLPNPEFAGRPYFIKDNSLVNFERADGVLSATAGMKGMVTFYGVPASKSDVRFSSSSLPIIFIRVDAGVDPVEVFSIVRADIGKKGREFIVRKTDRRNAVQDMSDVLVKFSFTKKADGIYELKFDNGITPGEYAIISSTETGGGTSLKSKISCFGVD